ncbi:hypothetical protein A9K55_004274 [Cordyceps militaris]|uniref:Uncharacterized protein n=1 Tax=Cordyceps militaris TaxID=73501 RepID=A0A2H4SQ57_CORMI|nr:hypothetical protein A9K55_004274 [Cordyceps militaris]
MHHAREGVRSALAQKVIFEDINFEDFGQLEGNCGPDTGTKPGMENIPGKTWSSPVINAWSLVTELPIFLASVRA